MALVRCVECGCLPPGHTPDCSLHHQQVIEHQHALRKNSQTRRVDEIEAGGFTLRRLGDGKFWLEHPEGEGLQTSEAAVAGLLAGFFGREF